MPLSLFKNTSWLECVSQLGSHPACVGPTGGYSWQYVNVCSSGLRLPRGDDNGGGGGKWETSGSNDGNRKDHERAHCVCQEAPDLTGRTSCRARDGPRVSYEVVASADSCRIFGTFARNEAEFAHPYTKVEVEEEDGSQGPCAGSLFMAPACHLKAT